MFTHLREDIANIIARDPAARHFWEVFFCYPGLHAIIFHRWAKWCWTHGLKGVGRFIAYVARMITAVEIHPGASIGRRVFIDHGFGVVIGETAVVGDDCTIYQGVTLGGTSLTKGAKRHPTLEEGVIVGAGAQILGGFVVGAGAKIGSNSVVIKPVPAGATAVGNPAHIVQVDDSAHNISSDQIFSAYGVTANGDDPISKALRKLVANSVSQQIQIDRLQAAVCGAGIACEKQAEETKPNLDQINQLVD
jgi:serine O-acetyltransferase